MRRLPTFIAAVLLLAVAFPVAAAARTRPCNGASGLCARPFDRVVLPGSHNAMSNAEQGWNMPNQTWTIPHQLERGARAMLVDTHYGRPVVVAGSPRVADVTPAEYDPADGDRMYLCHASCGMGASDLVGVFRRITRFLENNPREVLLFDVEDEVRPDDFAGAVKRSGLIGHVYRGGTTHGTWMTLGQMVRTGQRVVFLGENHDGGTAVPWYHRAYDGILQETPYQWPRSSPDNPDGYTGVQFLTDPAALAPSCVPNRGGTTGSLFLMNHWVSGDGVPGSGDSTVPRPELAAIVNGRHALVARARACNWERGLMPTILAVDFFGTGDVVGAARELNGVRPAPYLVFRKRPRRVTARAGKPAVFRMTLGNLGDASGRPRVCAVPPRRLAARRCVTTVVDAGGSGSVVLRVKTRPRARGTGRVRFRVSGAGDRLTATARLRVKPKRHHWRR